MVLSNKNFVRVKENYVNKNLYVKKESIQIRLVLNVFLTTVCFVFLCSLHLSKTDLSTPLLATILSLCWGLYYQHLLFLITWEKEANYISVPWIVDFLSSLQATQDLVQFMNVTKIPTRAESMDTASASPGLRLCRDRANCIQSV